MRPFEHYDHGKDADPALPDILGKATEVNDITGTIGAEVKGIQLSQLSDAGKDQLALLVAQKKVVGTWYLHNTLCIDATSLLAPNVEVKDAYSDAARQLSATKISRPSPSQTR